MQARSDAVAEDLKALVKKKIAAFAVPNKFLVSTRLLYLVNCIAQTHFSDFPGSARPTKDTLREDNASHSEEDSSQPT